MKKKHIVFIACAAVVLVIAAVVGCGLQWFYSPGVHTFYKWYHFDYEDAQCYVVGSDLKTVIDTTTLTLKGGGTSSNSGNKKIKDFHIPGYLENPDFAIAFYKNDEEWHGSFQTYNGVVEYEGLIIDDSGYISLVDTEPVFKITASDTEIIYVIPADSEERALEILHKTLE